MPEFLQPTRRSDLFDLLQLAREKAAAEGEPLPRRFCVISYGLDLASRDGPKSQSDYARIWGYSRSWVCRNIDDIAAEAEAQRTFYREERETEMGKNHTQQRDNSESTRQQQPDNRDRPPERQNGEKDESAQQRDNIESTHSQQRDNTNRSHYSDYQNITSPAPGAQARGEDPPEVHSPPDPPEAAPSLDFLAEKQEPHRAGIEYAFRQMGGEIDDPSQLAARCDTEWQRMQTIKPYEVRQLLATEDGKYSPEVVLAAIVIAGDDNNPSKNFLHGILRDLHAQQKRTRDGHRPDADQRSPADGSDFAGRKGWWPSDDWGRPAAA
jgi:hypothetical protein